MTVCTRQPGSTVIQQPEADEHRSDLPSPADSTQHTCCPSSRSSYWISSRKATMKPTGASNALTSSDMDLFFFDDTATTEISTLSLHGALFFFFKDPPPPHISPFPLPGPLPI